MIYTSYFAKSKQLDPDKYIFYSIAQYNPKGYKGQTISALAPSAPLLKWWKNSAQTSEDEFKYIEQYTKETLSNKNPKSFAEGLITISEGKIPVLLCYEKSESFCHRHIIQKWLTNAGIECEEIK